jgi:hypothetical protein
MNLVVFDRSLDWKHDIREMTRRHTTNDDTSTSPVGAMRATLLSTRSGKNEVNAVRIPPPCTRQ